MCFKSKLIIIITDTTAVVTHTKGKSLISRWTIKVDDILGIRKIQQYVRKNKKCIVYLVLNHSQQIFQQHALNIPFTSNKESFLNSLVSDDIKENYPLIDLKTLSNNKNDQLYLVIAAQLGTEWLNFVNDIDSQFKAIALSPLEYQQVINVLSLGLPNDLLQDRWDILFMQNTDEQMHVVIYHNNIFYKATFIDLPENNNITIRTGYLKQEIDNVINGLAAGSSDNLNVYIIVSEQVKSKLLAHDFKQPNIILISPHEASIMLGLDWLMSKDEPCNLIAAYNILIRHRANHMLHTKKSKDKKRFFLINQILNFILVPLAISTLAYPTYVNHNLYLHYKSHKELSLTSRNIQAEIDHLLINYDPKDGSLPAKHAMKVGHNMGNIELLKYILSFHKKNRDLISQVRYSNYHNSPDNRPPVINISVSNKKLFTKRNTLHKKHFDKLYVEMHYE